MKVWASLFDDTDIVYIYNDQINADELKVVQQDKSIWVWLTADYVRHVIATLQVPWKNDEMGLTDNIVDQICIGRHTKDMRVK